MEEWKEYRLGEICKVINGRAYKQEELLNEGKYKVLRVGNIFQGNKWYYSDLELPDCKYCYNGDLLYAWSCDFAPYIWHGDKTIYHYHIWKLEENKDVVDRQYLYYYLQIRTKTFLGGTHGSVMLHMTKKDMEDQILSLPSLTSQKRIASILSSLDDKIALNRKINSNLEEQAKAIFQSWKKRIKELPHSSINLSEVARFIGGYSYKGNELQPSSQAMATIKNFERKGGFKVDGYKEIIPSEKIKQEQYAKVYDILVAHTDLTQNADVIGNAEMILSKGSHNRILFSMDLVKVEPKQNFPYRYFLIALLQDNAFKSHCLGYVNGTTVLHLSKKALPDFVFDIPTDRKLIEQINLLLSYYYQKRAEIMTESSDLASLRNVLLPRLMSGELVVR